MKESRTIKVNDLDIKIFSVQEDDYLCISDFVGDEESSKELINSWLRNKNTIEFLGIWEKINNDAFKGVEFDTFKNEAGTNRFRLSPTKWISKTGAIGLKVKAGKYGGGTFAHIDIALEFASWLSPDLKLYIIKEFQRLKKEEAERSNELAQWDNYRWLSKVNYRIQSDSIKENIIDRFNVPKLKHGLIYSNEADMLNVIVFGMTAKDFEKQNPRNNLREEATTEQLAVLSNLEVLNANMINDKIDQHERFSKLSAIAKQMLKSVSQLNMPPRRDMPLLHPSKQITKASTVENLISNLSKNEDLVKISKEQVKKIDTTKKSKK